MGDNLLPKNIIPKVQGNFILEDYHHPDDDIMDYFKPEINTGKKYEYGSMTFMHPLKATNDDCLSEYEVAIVDFVEKNHTLFRENDVERISIFIEIFHEAGGQCNFRIFDWLLLKRLTACNVHFPVSVYAIEMDRFLEWEKEVQLIWEQH